VQANNHYARIKPMKTVSFFSAMALALTVNITTVHAATNVYVVTGIPAGQVLNMRSAAGASNAVTGKIPFNSQGVVATGEEKKVNGTVWAKVYSNGVGGWVSKKYLLPEGKKATVQPAKPATPTVTPSKAAPAKSATKPTAKPATPAVTPRKAAPAKPATPAITPRSVIVPPIKIPSHMILPKAAIK
jgi:uncharacterized protein YgiM (DUF1202 family)